MSSQFDNQPGYGYLPSSLWPTGRWVNDWLALSVPLDLHSTQAGAPYSLVVRLYEVDTGRDVLIRRLGELDWAGEELLFSETERSFTAPTPMEGFEVTFGDKVTAEGLDVTASNDQIVAVIHWQAVASSQENFRHFVHLINPATGEIVAQHDAMPLFDTYPTSQWSRGEYVSDPAVLDTSEVPAGSYQLSFGLYRDLGPGSEPNRFERLSAIDGSEKRLENDAVISAEPVLIER